jgi:hypothetical protein
MIGKELIKSSAYITKYKYNTLDSIIFGFVRQTNWNDTTLNKASIRNEFTETAIGLKIETTIGDKLCLATQGRIFNDTWDSRKTSANLMQSPIDIYEHVSRLQNWSDNGESIPALGWGKAYSTAAQIQTGATDGSFDDTRLTTSGVTAITAARQIFDATEGMSDEIKRSLAKEFFFAGYINREGEEAIEFLPKIQGETYTGLTTINLASCIAVGDIIEPDVKDIWNEFTFEYQWQEWAEKYAKKITITHPEAAAYSADYISGVTNAGNAQDLWSAAHVIYNDYHVVNKMPDEYGQLKWITTEADAIWHIRQRLAWIGQNRIPLTVSYDVGRLWHIGTRFVLNIPHQTDGVNVTCIIEQITKSYTTGTVDIVAIALDPLPARAEWLDTLSSLNTNYEDTLVNTNPNYEDTL